MTKEYRVDRIYVADIGRETTRHAERVTYAVTADSAHAAAVSFMRDENARLLGTINELPGDPGHGYGVAARTGLRHLRQPARLR